VGAVPDVRPHLAAAEVVVAPLHIARGVQNKVLEALAMERAVIASPAVCRGLAATPGQHLLEAALPTAWQTHLSELLADADARARLAAAGRAYVVAHHDWSRCLAPATDWLASVTGEPTPSSAAARVPAGSAA
jgi:polysaccharide biosynthesis protein PslH